MCHLFPNYSVFLHKSIRIKIKNNKVAYILNLNFPKSWQSHYFITKNTHTKVQRNVSNTRNNILSEKRSHLINSTKVGTTNTKHFSFYSCPAQRETSDKRYKNDFNSYSIYKSLFQNVRLILKAKCTTTQQYGNYKEKAYLLRSKKLYFGSMFLVSI